MERKFILDAIAIGNKKERCKVGVPGATMSLRTRAYILCWTFKGKGVYRIDGKSYPGGPDDIILLRPFQRVEWTNDPLEPSLGYSIPMGISSMAEGWPPEASWPVKRHLPADDIIRPLFEYVMSNAPDCGKAPPVIKSAIETMLGDYLCGPQARTHMTVHSFPPPVQKVMDFFFETMNSNPARKITLKDLAIIASVSHEHLCRLFQHHVGYTPMDVLYLYRITRSLIGLNAGESVETLANEFGFADASHYARRFFACFGKLPSQMRSAMARGFRPKLPKLPFMG